VSDGLFNYKLGRTTPLFVEENWIKHGTIFIFHDKRQLEEAVVNHTKEDLRSKTKGYLNSIVKDAEDKAELEQPLNIKKIMGLFYRYLSPCYYILPDVPTNV
jgi:hypothetical protein